MNNPWAANRLKNQLKLVQIVWFAIMMAPLTLAFVLSRAPQEPVDWNHVVSISFFQVLAFVAISTSVLAHIVPNFIFNASYKAEKAKPWNEERLRSATTPKGQRLYRDEDIPQLVKLNGEDLSLIRSWGPYFISKIIQWVLIEATGVLGFMIAYTFHSFQLYLPFLALALGGMLITTPSSSELRRKIVL